MLWKNRRESENVVDQRRVGGKAIGISSLIVGAILYALLGSNPIDFFTQNYDQVQFQQSSPTRSSKTNENDDQKRFVAVVLADTEDVWNEIFRRNRITYREPKLVLFSHATHSACGQASSFIGPFYCTLDQRVYLDLQFFNQLSRSLGAQGDFAIAYVIAHEVGHHVQNLLGIANLYQQQVPLLNKKDQNRVSVQNELQADCLAGVWAKQTEKSKNVIEEGDINEAMNAAAAIGDDQLQKRSRGEVIPDSFTHGSSEQRVRAFQIGFNQGSPQTCLDSYRFY